MLHVFLNTLLMIVLGTMFVGCAGDVVGTNSPITTSDAQSADATAVDTTYTTTYDRAFGRPATFRSARGPISSPPWKTAGSPPWR